MKKNELQIKSKSKVVANCDHLGERIVVLRGQPVMLDHDLAELYGVPTKRLNEQVKRNGDRFPDDFRLTLTKEELGEVVANCDHLGMLRFSPAQHSAFTEQGVAMLATVLRSQTAVRTSIEIMRAFVAMRRLMLASAGLLERIGSLEIKQRESDQKLTVVFEALDRFNMLPSGIVADNHEFDALRFITRHIESAKKTILLIDPYSDVRTLECLAKKASGVAVTLICKDRGMPTKREVADFNSQYGGLTVRYSEKVHDRFIAIDGIELYSIGTSLNHIGQRLFSFAKRPSSEIAKLLKAL